MDKKTIDGILTKLKNEYVQIESNDSLSQEQKISKVINYTSGLCAAIAIQPIPFADIFVLTPIQAYMGTKIAAIYGLKIQEQGSVEIVKQIGGTVGLGLLAQQLAIGAYKTILPFLGAITTIPLVYAMTYGIGNVMNLYFKAKAEKKELSDQEIKHAWKEYFRKGKDEGKKEESNIKAGNMTK